LYFFCSVTPVKFTSIPAQRLPNVGVVLDSINVPIISVICLCLVQIHFCSGSLLLMPTCKTGCSWRLINKRKSFLISPVTGCGKRQLIFEIKRILNGNFLTIIAGNFQELFLLKKNNGDEKTTYRIDFFRPTFF
jgi:hypothetical protein